MTTRMKPGDGGHVTVVLLAFWNCIYHSAPLGLVVIVGAVLEEEQSDTHTEHWYWRVIGTQEEPNDKLCSYWRNQDRQLCNPQHIP